MIVKIIGGLGNQMFQYAFAYAVSQKKGSTLKLDIGGFEFYEQRKYALNHYYIDAEIANRDEVRQLKYETESLVAVLLRRLSRGTKPFAKSYYVAKDTRFDGDVFNQGDNVYFSGYWQSEKYFQSYRKDLLEFFTPKEPIKAKGSSCCQQISDQNSVSVHVRRGDYVTDERSNNHHGTCGLEYYREAIQFIHQRVDKAHFFIFSDDLSWAKDNLYFIGNVTFVDSEIAASDHEEMWLMSLCQHNVIANSSFSWWGAWLNENPNKMVIAPKRWFADVSIDTSDLIPDSWTRL